MSDTPYWVIAVVILVLGVAGDYVLRRYQRTKPPESSLFMVYLGIIMLEIQARAARQAQRVRDCIVGKPPDS